MNSFHEEVFATRIELESKLAFPSTRSHEHRFQPRSSTLPTSGPSPPVSIIRYKLTIHPFLPPTICLCPVPPFQFCPVLFQQLNDE
eukprot:gene5095-biopygen1648